MINITRWKYADLVTLLICPIKGNVLSSMTPRLLMSFEKVVGEWSEGRLGGQIAGYHPRNSGQVSINPMEADRCRRI